MKLFEGFSYLEKKILDLQRKQQTQQKKNKPRWIQRDNVWFQESASRLLLPHAFGFLHNSLFLLPGLDLMMLHYFSSSNSLFFLSGLHLMMLRWVGFLMHLVSSIDVFLVGLHLHGTSSSLVWWSCLAGKSIHGDSSSMELDLFTLDLAQQNQVLCTRFVRLLNSFKTLLTNEFF